jgi:hypothetical protein
MDTDIWYCSYGSNLLFERFRLYIEGGEAAIVKKSYRGCNDPTLPERSEGYIIPYELYFSKKSRQWENGGVAFIAHGERRTAKTYCRIYRISADQFREVVQQENGLPADASGIRIDFEALLAAGTVLIGSPEEYKWYGKLICVGMKENIPVITFTAKWDISETDFSPPGLNYLSTIIKGLKETFPDRQPELLSYLESINGLKDNYAPETLNALMEKNE